MSARHWFAIAALTTLAAAGASAAGESQVADATRQGNREAVRTLLARRADVNAPEVDGTTALHWAVRADDRDMVALLIKAGADVRAANRYGITPLWQAAVNGNAEIIDALITAGADVNGALASGETPLLITARTGKTAAVRALVSRGANVNARENVFGQTALMLAAAENHSEVCRLLIEAGADPKAKTALFKPRSFSLSNSFKGEFTALLYAARQGSIESARVLLAAGSDPNEQDPDGVSALLLAIFNGHYDFASMLIESGADVNLADQAGRGPLYQAIDMRRLEFIAGRPAPKWTDKLDALDMVKLLLAKGANPNAQLAKRQPMRKAASPSDSWLAEGTTPILKAAKNADVPALRILLAHGADPHVQAPKVQASALMLAAGVGWRELSSIAPEKDALEAVTLLWDLGGFDINAASSSGQTALHGAASRGAATIVQYLVDHGADLFAKDKKGKTPLDEAGAVEEGMADGTHPVRPEAQALLRRLMDQPPARIVVSNQP